MMKLLWEKVFTKISQESCKMTYLREKCHLSSRKTEESLGSVKERLKN